MKVLISAYSCTPNKGSEPGFGWNWTLELAKLGYDIWCFTTPRGRVAIETELKNYTGLKINFVYIDVPGWLNVLYRFQPFLYLHYLVWQNRAYRKALKVDGDQNFDIVLHVTLGSFQLGSEMWKLGKPFIFGPVGGGNFPPVAFKKYFYGKWGEEVIRKWTSTILLRLNSNTKNTAKKAQLILATNNETYQMAKKIGAKRLEYFLDTGLPSNFFPDELPERRETGMLQILWVGRMFARKGLPVVLEALSKVRSDIPFRLTILGDGRLGHLIPSMIKQYGLGEKTEWRGLVPWNEVKKAYLEHDVFMFCSLRDSFGAQFLEAMAYGLPIVTLNHQGAADHIPDSAGIKVDVSTPDETTRHLAEAIEYLYDHPEERYNMGKNGNEFSKNHLWELKARRMGEYFVQLVGK